MFSFRSISTIWKQKNRSMHFTALSPTFRQCTIANRNISSAIFTLIIFHQSLPETIAEVYARHGIYDLVPASKDRVTGWNSVHYYLRHDKENDSKLKIFSTCFNLIRTLPLAIHDELHPEDVDSTRQGKEHWDALDDLRYFLQTVREQRTKKPLSIVERRIEALKNQDSHYDFSYKRNINYGD